MKNKIYILFFIVLSLVSSYLIYNLNTNYDIYDRKFYYLDNFIYVKLYTNDKNASTYMDEVEKIYKKYSELTNLKSGYPGMNNAYYICNNHVYSYSLKLDSRLYDLIDTSLSYMNEVDNFDIRFGKEKLEFISSLESGIVPNFTLYDKQKVVLLNDSILNENNCLDFSSIIHGYTNKLVSDYLQSVGVKRYIIDNGGVVTLGKYYLDNGRYSVALEDPNNLNNIYSTIYMNNKTVASKGNMSSSYFINDNRYSSIIDFNNKKMGNEILSISVISSDPTKAEVYASSLFNLGVEDALKIVNNTSDLEAIFYISKDEQVLSSGFNTYLK